MQIQISGDVREWIPLTESLDDAGVARNARDRTAKNDRECAARLPTRHLAARVRAIGLEPSDKPLVSEHRVTRYAQTSRVDAEHELAKSLRSIRRVGRQALEEFIAVQERRQPDNADGRAIAAPSPMLRRGNQARADRVEHDIAADIQ